MRIDYENGDWYEGETDTAGDPHGTGTYYFSDGGRYDGDMYHGRIHGHGVYWQADGTVYIGMFWNNAPNGTGKYTYGNGDVYEGEVKQASPHEFVPKLIFFSSQRALN